MLGLCQAFSGNLVDVFRMGQGGTLNLFKQLSFFTFSSVVCFTLY